MSPSDRERAELPPRRPLPVQPRPGATPALPKLPVGYPLSYFADTEPFAMWLRGISAERPAQKGRPPKKTPPRGEPPKLPGWMDDVRLVRFTSRRISRITKKEPYTGIYDGPARPYSGAYEYIVEFTTTREIALALPEPKGTIALFGRTIKKGETPARLRLRFIVDAVHGRLIRVDISGALRFKLSQSLVRPVQEHNHQWINSPHHTHVVVPLGGSMITLGRSLRPRIVPPLSAPPLTVRIGPTAMVARLTVAKIDITGSAARPRIRFNKIRLVYLIH
jgi:hypothetical protein